LDKAPVAIFAFNRPGHLKQLLKSLEANSPIVDISKLFLFIDGARNDAEVPIVNQVLEIATEMTKNKNVEIIQRIENFGLSKSIISGVNKVFETHDRVIVLEDDLFVSPEFLKFCNEGLDMYLDEKSVASIQGYSEDLTLGNESTFFQRGADCWGWATWKNRWEAVEWDGNKLLATLKNSGLEKMFNYNGSFPYSNMLYRQTAGYVDSWAIRWHASMFLQNRYSLYPTRTLVENLGRDGSGTHPGINKLQPRLVLDRAPVLAQINVEDSKAARRNLEKIYRRKNGIYPLYSPKKYFNYVKRKLNAK
jgi:hypothetical protein